MESNYRYLFIVGIAILIYFIFSTRFTEPFSSIPSDGPGCAGFVSLGTLNSICDDNPAGGFAACPTSCCNYWNTSNQTNYNTYCAPLVNSGVTGATGTTNGTTGSTNDTIYYALGGGYLLCLSCIAVVVILYFMRKKPQQDYQQQYYSQY